MNVKMILFILMLREIAIESDSSANRRLEELNVMRFPRLFDCSKKVVSTGLSKMTSDKPSKTS